MKRARMGLRAFIVLACLSTAAWSTSAAGQVTPNLAPRGCCCKDIEYQQCRFCNTTTECGLNGYNCELDPGTNCCIVCSN